MTTPTPAEIQQAVAWGQQVALRKVLDALAAAKPGGAHLLTRQGDPTSGSYWDDRVLLNRGYDAAVRVVREFKIDTKEGE